MKEGILYHLPLLRRGGVARRSPAGVVESV